MSVPTRQLAKYVRESCFQEQCSLIPMALSGDSDKHRKLMWMNSVCRAKDGQHWKHPMGGSS